MKVYHQNTRENFQRTFYSNRGGCVDGLGRVLTTDGFKLVKDLKKGDIVINSEGQQSEIVCVLKRQINDGAMDMLSINKMKITLWHPIRVNNKWQFPAEIGGQPLKINVDYVYNFVLSENHFITINDIDVVTLGHGYLDDPVLSHPFFATQKVIEQLKSHSGWKSGLIEYEYNPSYDKSGLVCSLWK